MPCQPAPDMVASLKKAAAALRDANVPFAVGGGFAVWARGGPAPGHDIDLMIREEDVPQALEAVEAVGMKTERPPEGWLVKAWDGEVLVDLIFHPSGLEITDEVLGRTDTLPVGAVPMAVLRMDDVLVTKLLSATEQHLDYEGLLEVTRALREQVDWDEVRRRTEHSAFARGFLHLAGELGIIERRT